MKTSRPIRALATIPILVCALLLAASAVLMPGDVGHGDRSSELATLLLICFFVLASATVGAWIVSRFPRNVVGWILMFIGLAWALASFGLAYIEHSTEVNPLPGTGFFIVTQSLWTVGIAGPMLLPFVFPGGRPLNEMWRRVTWLTTVMLVALVVAQTLAPEAELQRLGNPYSTPFLRDIAMSVQPALFFGLLPLGGLAVISLVMRGRRGGWVERQQIKWLVFAVALVVATMSVVSVLEAIGLGRFGNLLAAASVSVIPLAIGVAVLRHGLYDIDLVINRTLVYAILTGFLAVTYLGLVVIFQRILAPVTLDSDLAVAGSTLAVAAAFRPLRSRIQDFIDRRFYRTKYDAVETLAHFSSRLRDEVDLDALSRDLVAAIGSTMQPRYVSLWLRTETGGRRVAG